MLPFAVITITGALIFYTVGVFSEKITGFIKLWHLILFWIGFVFDTTGTTLMGIIAGGTLAVNIHSVTGFLAIILMAIHAVWATITLIKGDETQKRNFHKFSIVVWAIWLVPYWSGMIYGMMK
ncbi:MAG: HsmA family protein [Lawsonibacter sp.]|nr:HsmA family protein [Lawsonibacter sp.]